ncbi:hypothetical protein [Streptomyces sp. CA-132043]|uniref:hypothetical protein n=1 Tax=Streptomyces sp. CA-132043 TaxID=3240048 RepID=UPI003D8D1423
MLFGCVMAARMALVGAPVKDLGDAEGDAVGGRRTIAVVHDLAVARALAMACAVLVGVAGVAWVVARVVRDARRKHAELREPVPTSTLRPGQRLTLNSGGMTFCGSSGLSALMAARNHALALALALQADIALAAVPAHTLRIAGLDQILPLHPDNGFRSRS